MAKWSRRRHHRVCYCFSLCGRNQCTFHLAMATTTIRILHQLMTMSHERGNDTKCTFHAVLFVRSSQSEHKLMHFSLMRFHNIYNIHTHTKTIEENSAAHIIITITIIGKIIMAIKIYIKVCQTRKHVHTTKMTSKWTRYSRIDNEQKILLFYRNVYLRERVREKRNIKAHLLFLCVYIVTL